MRALAAGSAGPAPPVRGMRSRAVGFLSLALLLAAACDAGPGEEEGGVVPGMDPEALASGPFSGMEGVLERTILAIDVLRVRIRFGSETADRLRSAASGRGYSAALADSVAAVAVATRDALVRVEFRRGIDLERYVEEVTGSLRAARDAGLLSPAEFRTVSARLRPWFSFLEERGLREGDRLAYRIRGDTVRTVYRSRGGETLLDQTDPAAPEQRRAIVGGYLAPGTDLREKLIRSLLEAGG